jgi:hypothetical protein
MIEGNTIGRLHSSFDDNVGHSLPKILWMMSYPITHLTLLIIFPVLFVGLAAIGWNWIAPAKRVISTRN